LRRHDGPGRLPRSSVEAGADALRPVAPVTWRPK